MEGEKLYQQVIDRTGFGNYQFLVIFTLGLVAFMQGVQTLMVSLLGYVFMEIWDLSTTVVSLYPAAYSLGRCIGITVSCLFGDSYGRIRMIKIGLCINTLGNLSSFFAPSFYCFISLRVLVGIGIGFVLPVFAGYISETTPTKHISTVIMIMMSMVPIGILVALGLFFLFMPGLDNQNFKYLVLIFGSLGIAALFFAVKMLVESPLNLIQRGQFTEGVKALKRIIQRNKSWPLSQQQESGLHLAMLSNSEKDFLRIDVLFKKGFSKITCLLVVLWHCGTIIYFGFFMILSVALSLGSGNSAIFLGWVLSALIMIPFYYVTIWMVQHQKLGTRRTLMICFALLMVAELSAIFLVGTLAFYGSVICLTGLGIMAYNSLYTYTNEIYPPEVKSTSLGFFNFITALTGISISSVMFQLNEISPSLPYTIMGILALLGCIITILLPVPAEFSSKYKSNQ